MNSEYFAYCYKIIKLLLLRTLLSRRSRRFWPRFMTGGYKSASLRFRRAVPLFFLVQIIENGPCDLKTGFFIQGNGRQVIAVYMEKNGFISPVRRKVIQDI